MELTPEILQSLKEASTTPLFKTKPIMGQEYVFTYLTASGKKKLDSFYSKNQSATIDDINAQMVDMCIKWPPMDASKEIYEPAGLKSTLAGLIESQSLLNEQVNYEKDLLLVDTISETVIEEKPGEDIIGPLRTKSIYGLKRLGLEGKWYIIAPLLRATWRSLKPDGERSIEICRSGVLYPTNVDWDSRPAGHCDVIANAILKASGFGESEEVEAL